MELYKQFEGRLSITVPWKYGGKTPVREPINNPKKDIIFD